MHYFDMIEMHYFEERLLNGSFCLLASEFPRRPLPGNSVNKRVATIRPNILWVRGRMNAGFREEPSLTAR
jgi:hypothetical protein